LRPDHVTGIFGWTQLRQLDTDCRPEGRPDSAG
jgi:hypothetical protein